MSQMMLYFYTLVSINTVPLSILELYAKKKQPCFQFVRERSSGKPKKVTNIFAFYVIVNTTILSVWRHITFYCYLFWQGAIDEWKIVGNPRWLDVKIQTPKSGTGGLNIWRCCWNNYWKLIKYRDRFIAYCAPTLRSGDLR